VRKGLWFDSASGTGCVGVLVEPGGVGGQLTLLRSHLMDSSCHKLPQAHEGVRGKGGGILVVWGSGCIGCPVLEKHVHNAVPGGPVSFSHEFEGGDLCSWWRGGV